MRIVGEDGESLGVFPLKEALAKADPERGIDLIEVVPHARPPVAKLMSFDKFRYLQDKEEKRLKQAAKGSSIKQIQVTARAAEHDWLTKVKQLDAFLEEGHPVEVQMKLRGREKSPGMQGWVRERLDAFLGMISVEFKVIMPARPGGRGVIMQIGKK